MYNICMKNKEFKLDIKNQKILRELRFNGRSSFSSIAKEIGLSKETTIYRINQLKKDKIIMEYVPEIDPYILGYTIFRIVIKLKSMDKQFEKELEEYFLYSNMPVVWMGYLYGEWDFALGVMVKDSREFHEYMEKFNEKFGEHIMKKAIVIQVEDIFKHYNFLYGPITKRGKVGKTKKLPKKEIEFDKIDLKLIALLYEDARMPTIEIAKKMNISSDVVRYRLDKLKKKGIIKRFITTINRNTLGYRKYKVLLSFQHMTPKENKKLLGYCKQHPNISHISTCVGSWDMEIDYDSKTPEEFNELFMHLRDMFDPVIHEYSILLNYKYEYANPFINLIKEKDINL